MGKKERQGKKSDVPIERHLILSSEAKAMWLKLRWEASRLQTAREAVPFDLTSTIYGAINFAITAQSLEDWTIKALKQRNRRSGLEEASLEEQIIEAIPMQAAFRAIANTAKHGQYLEGKWIGGTVELKHMPGFAGTPKEYVLIYYGEGFWADTSLDLYDNATAQWRNFLTRSGFSGFEDFPLQDD